MTDSMLNVVLKSALTKIESNEWEEERTVIVLDLIEEWLSKNTTFETYVDDVGYDRSVRSSPTGCAPNFWNLNTLKEWMTSSTGQDKPTFMSGCGMRAETWEELLNEELEKMIDDFSYEILGEALEDDDYDTICDIRILLQDNEDIRIGNVESYCDSAGYLGWISELTPDDFVNSIPLEIALQYPFLKQACLKKSLNKNLENIIAEKTNTTQPSKI